MTSELLVAGGGMGGLAAGLACARAGWQVHLFERAAQLAEVGAGIQLGPNSTRILRAWGLEAGLARVAAFPGKLEAFRASDGASLGTLRLGDFAQRYGAPYATIHRADLQSLLAAAASAAGVDIRLASPVSAIEDDPHEGVSLRAGNSRVRAAALVGADGLWSTVRAQVWQGLPPTPTGHVAYRGLVLQEELPARLRRSDVNVWLGARSHVVAYPVRSGRHLNVVAIVHGRGEGAAEDWDQHALAAQLHESLGTPCEALRDLVYAMPSWRLWMLNDRPPVSDANEMARGRVALLGDAAHPMRPYLAQGAGMAIEDAAALADALQGRGADEVAGALRHYAQSRWERCARVQERSRRNGSIFHATGPLRWGRDLAMGVLGESLLDMPWLYGH